MEKEFFDLFAKHREILYLNVSYFRSSDWVVSVTDMRSEARDVSILSHQGPDRALVFAKAYASLAEWYSETFGGY